MIERNALIVLIALSIAGGAHAADESARQAARQHFERGLELAGQRRYEQALSEFLAAYRERPHYAALYNIGQAYIELGRSVEAIEVLERYLEDGKDQLPLERLERVRRQVAAEEARTAQLIVSVEAPGASIAVDGLPVGSAPRVGPLRLMTGPHDVTLSNAGMPSMHRSVVLAAGQTLELAFPHAGLAAAAADPVMPLANTADALRFERAPTPFAEVADPGEDATEVTLGYVLGGVGLALGGVALGHYLWNRERYDRWHAQNLALLADPAGGQASRRERQIANNRLAASIERASRWTVASSVAGGAFLASGATLLVVHASTPGPVTRESATLFMLQGVW